MEIEKNEKYLKELLCDIIVGKDKEKTFSEVILLYEYLENKKVEIGYDRLKYCTEYFIALIDRYVSDPNTYNMILINMNLLDGFRDKSVEARRKKYYASLYTNKNLKTFLRQSTTKINNAIDLLVEILENKRYANGGTLNLRFKYTDNLDFPKPKETNIFANSLLDNNGMDNNSISDNDYALLLAAANLNMNIIYPNKGEYIDCTRIVQTGDQVEVFFLIQNYSDYDIDDIFLQIELDKEMEFVQESMKYFDGENYSASFDEINNENGIIEVTVNISKQTKIAVRFLINITESDENEDEHKDEEFMESFIEICSTIQSLQIKRFNISSVMIKK